MSLATALLNTLGLLKVDKTEWNTMLEKILHRLTSREQSHKQYTKPLRMATSYKYTPNEIIPEPKLDFNAILELAKQHPGFQTSTIKPCFLDQHALFVGFDKPARIATHVIVYPEQIYRSISGTT